VILLTDSELTQAEAWFTDLFSKIARSSYDYSKDGNLRTLSFR